VRRSGDRRTAFHLVIGGTTRERSIWVPDHTVGAFFIARELLGDGPLIGRTT
jgi:hypothetical protein